MVAFNFIDKDKVLIFSMRSRFIRFNPQCIGLLSPDVGFTLASNSGRALGCLNPSREMAIIFSWGHARSRITKHGY